MLDITTRRLIVTEVNNAIKNALQGANEKWLSGDQLSQQFSIFTKSWLKSYGHTLPRTQAIVHAQDGEHKTGWCYPLYKIQRMVQEGEIKQLKIKN